MRTRAPTMSHRRRVWDARIPGACPFHLGIGCDCGGDATLLTLPRGNAVPSVGVGDRERLTIGQLARRSGLTTKALRHYDRIGLLKPVEVDMENGYRRYAPEQIEVAVFIRRLRRLDLPLDEVRR